MAREEVTVALLGGGTVGTSVVELLTEHAEDFRERIGAPVRLTAVAVRDASKARPGIPSELITDDAVAVASSGVDIVVELMGGIETARECILAAMAAGSSVVTANKALLAEDGARLFKAFMLTKMDEEGVEYADVFAEADALGYLESDPSLDVDGHDAAAKAAILAELAFHTRVTLADVHVEGIADVTADDMAAARDMGFVIKLLAIAEKIDDSEDSGVIVRVHPTMLPRTHPLAAVRESFNAVFVEADAAGQLMFYGRGAGGHPTASAVLGDLVAAARNRVSGSRGPGESTYTALPVLPIGRAYTEYYVNLDVADRPGVLASVATAFAENGVSIQVVHQEGHGDDAGLVVRTHLATDAALEATVEQLRGLDTVRRVVGVMRVEGEEQP